MLSGIDSACRLSFFSQEETNSLFLHFKRSFFSLRRSIHTPRRLTPRPIRSAALSVLAGAIHVSWLVVSTARLPVMVFCTHGKKDVEGG